MPRHSDRMKMVCGIESVQIPGLMLSRLSAAHVEAMMHPLASVTFKSRLSYGRGGGPLAKVSSHCGPPVVSPA